MLVRFHEKLSEVALYLRYFYTSKLSRRIAHERMIRICFVDYDREIALVADYKDPQTGEREIIAMGHLSRQYGTAEAEFSLLVRDEFQQRGLGTEILRQLVAIGRDQQLHYIRAEVLSQNCGMLRILDKLGFCTHPAEDEDLIQAELVLADSGK